MCTEWVVLVPVRSLKYITGSGLGAEAEGSTKGEDHSHQVSEQGGSAVDVTSLPASGLSTGLSTVPGEFVQTLPMHASDKCSGLLGPS